MPVVSGLVSELDLRDGPRPVGRRNDRSACDADDDLAGDRLGHGCAC